LAEDRIGLLPDRCPYQKLSWPIISEGCAYQKLSWPTISEVSRGQRRDVPDQTSSGERPSMKN